MKHRETKLGQEAVFSTKLDIFSLLLYSVTLYRDLLSIGFRFCHTNRNKVTKKFSLSVGTKYDCHYTKIKTNCLTKKKINTI